MIAITNYEILEQLYESKETIVFSARSYINNQVVIIKILKNSESDLFHVNLFNNEFHLIKKIESDRIRKSIEILKIQGKYAIVLEYTDGITLKNVIQQKTSNISNRENFITLLKTSVEVIRAIEELHSYNIVHRDICSDNILVSKNILQNKVPTIKLIDFGLSIQMNQGEQIQSVIEKTSGDLSYISPEQTGRINRNIDHRSDLYSLGVVLYELFTRVLPFISNDPLELVHSHIAKIPTPPTDINREIPDILSRIIMKLLAKGSEERYQGTFGLIYDLENYVIQPFINKTNVQSEIKLGEYDYSGQLIVSQKIYGREFDILESFSAYTEVCEGGKKLMFISGYKGIGKTAFVKEIFKSLKLTSPIDSLFLNACFEKEKIEIPYYAWKLIFKNIVDNFITSDIEKLIQWEEYIYKNIKNFSKLISKINSDIEILVNFEQSFLLHPEDPEIYDIIEQSYIDFIRIFSNQDRPLVIHLDNLQYSDLYSLQLLKLLFNHTEIKYLFVICSYSDNELASSEFLSDHLDELLENPFTEVIDTKIENLTQKNVEVLLSDTLLMPAQEVQTLAESIYSKTNGNPYYTLQFLKNIYDEDLIKFNYPIESQKAGWKWDVQKIKQMSITENVIDILTKKIKKLKENQKKLLGLCACIGLNFQINVLSLIYQKNIHDTKSDLEVLFNARFIEFKDEDMDSSTYSFINEKIHRVAYQIVSEIDRTNIHLMIGKTLISNQETDLIKIANQINKGIKNVTDSYEKVQFSKLNLDVSLILKKLMDYETSIIYLYQSLSFLGDGAWSLNYNLSIKIYAELLELNMLLKEFTEVESIYQAIQNYFVSSTDKSIFYEIRILSFIIQNKTEKAIELGLDYLNELDINIAKENSAITFFFNQVKMQYLINTNSISEIANREEIKDQRILSILRIISSLLYVAYTQYPILFKILLFICIRISIQHGNSSYSTIGYMFYSIYLVGKQKNYDLSIEFNNLCTILIEKYNYNNLLTKLNFVSNCFVVHWKNGIVSSASQILETYHTSMQTKDLEYGAYTLYYYSMYNFFSGKHLNELILDFEFCISTAKELKNENVFQMLSYSYQKILKFVQIDADEVSITDSYKNIETNHFVKVVYFIQKYMIACYFDTHEFTELFQIADKNNTIFGSYWEVIYSFYSTVVLLRSYPNFTRIQKIKAIVRVHQAIHQFKIWSDLSEEHKHRYFLIKAEWYRIQENYEQTMRFYNLAIIYSKKTDFIHERGLCNELFAKYQLSLDNQSLFECYINEAYKEYKQWGAESKLKDIELKYKDKIKIFNLSLSSESSNYNHEFDKKVNNLDLYTIVKASYAFSGEIELSRLLEKLIQILIENAGAQKGYLILPFKRKDTIDISDLCIEAEGDSEGIVSTMQSIMINSNSDILPLLPIAIIQQTLKSKKEIVLDNAFSDPLFSVDKYIQGYEVKSVIAAPMINQGKLIGIIYLENNLVAGAFTPDRIELLQLLSTQAAISIENARLFNEMKELNEANRRFVPKQLLTNMGKTSIKDFKIGDQIQKEMTVMFTDIRDFTTLSEKMTPQDNFNFINSYLSKMGPIVRKNNGFIDKYIGDAIMSIFSKTPEDALIAAIEMHIELSAYNSNRILKDRIPIQIGVGIHTGNLMMGIIGEHERMEGTVISDAVNLASRLEGLNKIYKTGILISDSIYYKINTNNYSIRFIDRVRVKGKSKYVSIFEVYDILDESNIKLRKKNLAQFENALVNYFYGNFEKSKEILTDYLEKYPNDRIANIYLDRCIDYICREEPPEVYMFPKKIEWDNLLKTNIALIDKQHIEIVALLNDLFTKFAEINYSTEIEKVLTILEKYIIDHFVTEEEYMKTYLYPNLEAHKREHADFLAELQTLKKLLTNSVSILPLVIRIDNYVVYWILNHIKNADYELGKFLSDK